jgi:hypothetical protein
MTATTISDLTHKIVNLIIYSSSVELKALKTNALGS